MKINNLSSPIFSTEYLTKQRNENLELPRGIDDALRNGTAEIKTHDNEEALRLIIEKVDRQSQRRNDMYKALKGAFMAGKDPVEAILQCYNENVSQINSSSLEDDEKAEDLQALDDGYNFCAEKFASEIHQKLFKVGIKTDPNNPMSQIYDGIDREKLQMMEKDIVTMFQNAKQYYDKEGSFKNIPTYIIQANTSTISFRDLIKMNSIIKNMEKENESFSQIIQNERLYGNGIDEDEYKIMTDYIKEKADKLGVSAYTKGLYIDLFF